MNNNSNQWIIEINDIIEFDLKIKNKSNNEEPLKITDKQMTIGLNSISEEIDKQLIGLNLNNDKLFEFELKVINDINIFENVLQPADYVLSFKIKKLEKYSNCKNNEETNIEEEMDKHKDEEISSNENINKESDQVNNLLSELNNLKELNNSLQDKIIKLEEEKATNESAFKMKAEEIAKNAVHKIETIKEEIKVKAKEEIENKSKFAIQKLVENLIGPISNLDIVIESGSNNDNPLITGYVKGFQMILSQIFTTLESNGVKTINPIIGDEYKPEIHEAQEVIESKEFKKDQIIKIVSKGYTLHDRVIKPAIVIVAK